MNVAEVDLDDWNGNGLNGIPQRHGSVAVTTRIEDDANAISLGVVKRVDQLAFHVALERVEFDTVTNGLSTDRFFQFGKGT